MNYIRVRTRANLFISNMSEKGSSIKVGLSAFGMSGRVFHTPLIHAHPHFALHAVLQRRGDDALRHYPECRLVKNFRDLLNDDNIELIVVNTPEYLHFEMAAQVLEAGKHVVVEKAFTPTVLEAQQLIELAQKNQKILSVFQNSRWHGDFLTIKKIVENRMLGQLVDYEAHYDRFRNYIDEGNWKENHHPGTGVLYNLGSHMIDQVLQLFGWPQSVQADIRIQRPGGKVEDNFELVMNYGPLKVTLKSSYLVREAGPRYVLHGTQGSYIKYGADPQEALLKAGKSPLEDNWGKEPPSMWGSLNTQLKGVHLEGKVETLPGAYMGFYDNIYAAIREGKELEVKPEQAMRVIAIIEAAVQSNQEKRRITLEATL